MSGSWPKDRAQFGYEFSAVERLSEEAQGSPTLSRPARKLVIAGCDQDNGKSWVFRPCGMQKFPTGNSGQANIGDEAVYFLKSLRIQKCFGRQIKYGGIPAGRQKFFHRLEDTWIVIDNADAKGM
jgi:hypothetical protein